MKPSHAGFGLALTLWAFAWSTSASAQLAPPPSQSSNTPPTAAMMMNPYLNPYMNPLLNPAAANQKVSGGNALLYLYSAQAAQGGIGSGRLSNGSGRQPLTKRKPENMPNSAMVPGSGAARYFNPTGAARRPTTSRYFNQSTGHFQNTRN